MKIMSRKMLLKSCIIFLNAKFPNTMFRMEKYLKTINYLMVAVQWDRVKSILSTHPMFAMLALGKAGQIMAENETFVEKQ